MKRHVLIFGVVGGLLIAILQYTEYRFIVIEHSIEIYSALIAALFAAFGIWLGLRITHRRETVREAVVAREVLVPAEAPALPAPAQASPPTASAADRAEALAIFKELVEINITDTPPGNVTTAACSSIHIGSRWISGSRLPKRLASERTFSMSRTLLN